MRGASARLLLGGMLVAAAAGCSRVGFDGGPEAPSPDAGTETVVRTPSAADRIERTVAPTRVLDETPLEVEGADPLLYSIVRDDTRLTERVDYWIDFWTSRGSGHFGRYLERMARYHPIVDQELKERGLPLSLRYLPVVESGYHLGAVSRVGATGLWQIMTPTARDLGLSVSTLVDDRRDPVASTRAALDYLEQLHRTFDSWFLALAAYNAGPGRVAGVIQRHAPADTELAGDALYLYLRPHLPAETREFVPRFFAAAAIAGDPERYGFQVPADIPHLAFEEVEVPDATSFDVLAEAAGVDEDAIRELNPHFLSTFTPVGEARVVRLPPGTGETFETNFAMIPPDERIRLLEHPVGQGETLTHIARRYSVSVADLQSANGSLDPRRLQVGQRLIVPVAGVQATASSGTTLAGADDTSGPADAQNGGAEIQPHRVRSGESLWTIARAYGVTVADLRRWNNLSENAVLQPGAELIVGSGTASQGARAYTVRAGDTWGGIAQRFGVRSADLARANGRTTGEVIRVGEELRIP